MFNDTEIKLLRLLVQHTKLDILSKKLDKKNVSIDSDTKSIMSVLTELDGKLFLSLSQVEQQNIIRNNKISLSQ
jgi:hypothetical protein